MLNAERLLVKSGRSDHRKPALSFRPLRFAFGVERSAFPFGGLRLRLSALGLKLYSVFAFRVLHSHINLFTNPVDKILFGTLWIKELYTTISCFTG
jgi:hypothetical protein